MPGREGIAGASLPLLAGVAEQRDPTESEATHQRDDDCKQKCDAFRAGDRQYPCAGLIFALQSEREEHRAFRSEKLKVFVGRESNFAALARYLDGEGAQPLVVHGRSGAGKSALMARASEDAAQAGHAPLITRFIGASAGSSDLCSLLISVVDDLADHC